jgi:16S rRNA (uracil1498-N3)-methyltransferase
VGAFSQRRANWLLYRRQIHGKIISMRRRFFVDSFSDNHATMHGEAAHHLGRVLRAQPGQLYELSDGTKVWLGRIEAVSRDSVDFSLLEELPAHHPTIETILLLSIVKFDSFEWALEKATELGVHTIVPLAAARSEKALLAAAPKRKERWKKILHEASQQSRRVRGPVLKMLEKPESAFRSESDGRCIFLSEAPEARPLREVIQGQNAKTVTLAIGPEGGWTEVELAAARACSFQDASLGNLILRTETAVIAALANINFALSD